MTWQNIKLILTRELKDQLRDRRTLFTVVVLPMLLYPFLGLSLIQITQFFREHRVAIWIVGAENLPQEPDLFVDEKFSTRWLSAEQHALVDLKFSEASDQEFSEVIETFRKGKNLPLTRELVDQWIQRQMAERNVDLAVVIPNLICDSETDDTDLNSANVFVLMNSASDKSKIATERWQSVVNQWQVALFERQLQRHQMTKSQALPVRFDTADIAQKSEQRAAAWSKILPLMIMVWCLTGAFYPAVDLCAGEKERGTFETLLSSPASRTEIALGKLLTVIVFSIATALLNLLSMGITTTLVMGKLGQLSGGLGLAALGPPPVLSLFWLVLAMVPVAALFGAVSLAAAAFARSSKEGQYYLVPLIMVSMPLMVLPMLPATQLDIGTSLIPVTNVMLLLRTLIEGNVEAVLRYSTLVGLVTVVCVAAAVRWVVYQFNSESVLFRASERFGVGAWLSYVLQHRGDLPTVGHALLCGLLILLTKFFVGFGVGIPADWYEFGRQTFVILLATVAVPAVLMAIVLTRRPLLSLRLTWCRPSYLAAAVFLAVCLHPAFSVLSRVILVLYPPSEGLQAMNGLMESLLTATPPLWLLLLTLAFIPAFLEELAFRGFILSGAQGVKNQWLAVVIASLFFGAAHAVFQQSVLTFFVGMVLGFLAVRTGSLWPCIVYHAVHNSLTVLGANLAETGWITQFSWLMQFEASGGIQYHTVPAWFMTGMGIALLMWIWKQTMEDSHQQLDWSKWQRVWNQLRGARRDLA
ncbi:MAG: CPBP family intramembrane metalloprotease [Pirellulaceae bacterium]|jgi:sodium transport system permease protein|nr:CPBP family intramembrane metalloprotease [Pirellulaceae bacterium]